MEQLKSLVDFKNRQVGLKKDGHTVVIRLESDD